MHTFLIWLARVRVDLLTPHSVSDMFCHGLSVDQFHLLSYTKETNQFTRLPPCQLVLQHPVFVIYVIKDQNFTLGPLWGLAALDRILIFRVTAAKPKQKFSKAKRICKTPSSFPWSGGNLVSGGVCSVFAWGAKMSCQAKLKREQQRQSKRIWRTNDCYKFTSLPCPLSVC